MTETVDSTLSNVINTTDTSEGVQTQASVKEKQGSGKNVTRVKKDSETVTENVDETGEPDSSMKMGGNCRC